MNVTEGRDQLQQEILKSQRLNPSSLQVNYVRLCFSKRWALGIRYTDRC